MYIYIYNIFILYLYIHIYCICIHLYTYIFYIHDICFFILLLSTFTIGMCNIHACYRHQHVLPGSKMGGAFQNLRKWGAPKVSQNERFWGFQVSRFFEDDKGSEISARVSCIHDERDGRIVDSASKDLPAKNSRFDFM